MKKLFVWDFHGTLEKGNENGCRVYMNMALEREGYERRLSEAECKMLYGRKLWEFFEYLLPEESKERLMELQGIFLEIEQKQPEILLSHIKPNDHALDLLARIRDAGHDQILISNTEIHMLMPFLSSVGMDQVFAEGKRFATNTHLGAQYTKHDKLKEYLDGKSVDHIVAVGDAKKDLEFVADYPSTTYLYSHPGWEFRDFPATYRIRDLREIAREL